MIRGKNVLTLYIFLPLTHTYEYAKVNAVINEVITLATAININRHVVITLSINI